MNKLDTFLGALVIFALVVIGIVVNVVAVETFASPFWGWLGIAALALIFDCLMAAGLSELLKRLR